MVEDKTNRKCAIKQGYLNWLIDRFFFFLAERKFSDSSSVKNSEQARNQLVIE